MTGADDRLEVWDRGRWADYNADLADDVAGITARSGPCWLRWPSTTSPSWPPSCWSCLDPRPGEVAVDCTFGAGGHARLVAERLGPEGELIAIDRDPAAAARFADASPTRSPCRTRFIAAPFADGARAAGRRGRPGRRRLPRPRHVLDAGRRAGSAASPTPTTRRWTCAWTRRRSSTRRRRRQRVGGAAPGPRPARLRRGALRRPHRARHRARARAGADHDDGPPRRRRHGGDPGARPLRRRPPGQAHLPGHPDRGQRRARPARRARSRSPGSCCARTADLQGSRSIPWKTGA